VRSLPCRDLTFAYLYFVQFYESWLPRHRRTSDRFPIPLPKRRLYREWHALRGFGVCFPTPCSSALHRPFSSAQLITDVQTVAGVISLINDYLVSDGKHPLGFLNPWLYGKARLGNGLQDIISGSNPGCDTDGFTAVPGWDPVRPARVSLHF
jgi:hypothetical protein